MLPEGNSVQLLGFDKGGDVLIDEIQSAPSSSTSVALALEEPDSAPAGALYVAVLIGRPSGSSSDTLGIGYQLQVTPETSLTPSAFTAFDAVFIDDGVVVVDSVTGSEASPSSTPQELGIRTSVNSQGTGVQIGPVSSGSGRTTTAQHGQSPQGPSPPPALSPGTVTMSSTSFDERDAQSSPSSSTPIDLGPLPPSQYEPAAGILSAGGPIVWVDPVEATRVDMSLVGLSTGRQGSPHEDPSSEQGLSIRDSVLHDTGKDRSGHVDVTVKRLSPDSPGPLRPGRPLSFVHVSGLPRSALGTADRRSFDLSTPIPLPLVTNGPVRENMWVSAASLPPIDEHDRPRIAAPTNRRSDETTEEGSPAKGSSRAGAILLGLSGSAVLGVSLYAPDLTAAVRRVVRSPVPKPRPRPVMDRDDRAPG